MFHDGQAGALPGPMKFRAEASANGWCWHHASKEKEKRGLELEGSQIYAPGLSLLSSYLK